MTLVSFAREMLKSYLKLNRSARSWKLTLINWRKSAWRRRCCSAQFLTSFKVYKSTGAWRIRARIYWLSSRHQGQVQSPSLIRIKTSWWSNKRPSGPSGCSWKTKTKFKITASTKKLSTQTPSTTSHSGPSILNEAKFGSHVEYIIFWKN